MGRGARRTIAPNIYQDRGGLAVKVRVGSRSKEVRFPPGTSMRELKAKRDALRAELRQQSPRVERGSLEQASKTFLQRKRALVNHEGLTAEMKAWTALYGPKARHRLTRLDVEEAIAKWTETGKAPKTIANRVHTLRNLFHTLDGPDAWTPCDGVRLAKPPKTPKVFIDPDLINRVDAQLEAHERRGYLRDQKTRARFRVLVSCGRRPCELMRAEPTDIDLARRLWYPRDAKGGDSPGIYLNDDMLAAWRFFIAVKAWGWFDTSSLARVLRTAGWPTGVRPYQARHSIGIALSEAGVDLADVQAMLGHKHIATTRRHYVPVLGTRLQKASELLAGRFRWGVAGAPGGGTDDNV